MTLIEYLDERLAAIEKDLRAEEQFMRLADDYRQRATDSFNKLIEELETRQEWADKPEQSEYLHDALACYAKLREKIHADESE